MEGNEELKEMVKVEVTKMFEVILSYTQIACTSTVTFKLLRSKILRYGNDCIRNIHEYLDKEEE